MGEMTVPLVALPGGLWGSPNPAWDHLIKRESSGRPNVIQEIHDVNSGGNEAEGLFQITPKTWDRHGGRDFAASARSATPQQQAIVAARIFTRNPTGSDWGAGRPGRENPRDLAAGLVPVGAGAAPTPAPAPAPPPASYGMPPGSNSGGYGGSGVKFPAWVYQLGDAFGIKPSTYPGHQESDRNEAGYAPNPQHLNRAIDWAAPGAPDQWDRLTRFADYLATIPQYLEQVIWRNPKTKRSIEVAGGRHQPGYFAADLAGHEDHVHTRQSRPIPIPGGTAPVPAPAPLKPVFEEREMFGHGSSKRSRPPINFLLHTEEGNSTAEQLARYCDGSHDVSYHYTLRDGIVYDVVDTDQASWSVLSANVFTINLCFAGSRAGWSREEWLKRERDIEIAAYIAVQDARKYGFSTEVIAPPYNGAARPGISDHKYVTQKLGIGTHTDVGDRFPWDVFIGYVNKYANTVTAEDDEMSAADVARLEGKIDRILLEQTQDGHTSLSQVREPNEGKIGTWCKIDRNVDGNVDLMATFLRALLKSPTAKARLQRVATNVEPGRSPDDALIAQQMLVTVDRILRLIEGSPPAVVSAPALSQPAPNPHDIAAAVAAILPVPVSGVEDVLRAENAALRAEIARLNTAPPPSVELVVPSSGDESIGDLSAGVIDSVTKYVNKATQLKPQELEALDRAQDVLKLNGVKK
jgi:hypothetical protein